MSSLVYRTTQRENGYTNHDSGEWLPGVYEDSEAVSLAATIPYEVLAALLDCIQPGTVITVKMLSTLGMLKAE